MSWPVHFCGVIACLQLAACAGSRADAGTSPISASLAPPPAISAGQGRPVEVRAHPDPLSLLNDKDVGLAANKRLVFDMWRSIVNAGQVDVADDLLREDYIQHSPVLPTGRAAFKAVFSAVQRRDVPALVSPALVTIIAERDLVVMAMHEDLKEPVGKGRYTTTHFNLFRVEGGKLAEHWHSVQTPPGPNVLPPDQGGPQPVTGAVGAAQMALLDAADPRLAGNKRLVFDAWRQLIDAGQAGAAQIYLAEDYIEHDPRGTTGRAAFVSDMKGRADVPVADFIRAPLVAMVAQGDLVVVIISHEHPHPSRDGATYTITEFDMFRIADNRLAEHWSGAVKSGTIIGPYTN